MLLPGGDLKSFTDTQVIDIYKQATFSCPASSLGAIKYDGRDKPW